MVDEGKYYENDDTVVEVIDVDAGVVTYRLVQAGGAPVSNDVERTMPVDDFEMVYDECGAAGVTFSGP